MTSVTIQARSPDSFSSWNVLHFARIDDASIDHANLAERARRLVDEEGWGHAQVTINGVRVYYYSAPYRKHPRRPK